MFQADFQAGFNTPKYRLNAGFGNSGLGKKKNIGFNVNLRWQDEFYWEGGGLADGTCKSIHHTGCTSELQTAENKINDKTWWH